MLELPRRDWKFRAWIIPEKRMMDWREFLLGNDRYNMLTGFGNECFACNPPKYHSHVMQWTGVTDKNGIDIYEGDILAPLYGHDNRLVMWNNNNHAGVIGWNLMEMIDGELEAAEFYYGRSPNAVDTVIGNIFETPELMEQS